MNTRAAEKRDQLEAITSESSVGRAITSHNRFISRGKCARMTDPPTIVANRGALIAQPDDFTGRSLTYACCSNVMLWQVEGRNRPATLVSRCQLMASPEARG